MVRMFASKAFPPAAAHKDSGAKGGWEMRRRSWLWLLAALLLAGCGEKTQERAALLQQRYASLAGYETELRAAVPREDETLVYTLRLTKDADTVRAEVREPAALAGVAAVLTGSELTLAYDGTALDAGTLSPRVSALNAAPLLLDSFAHGCLDSCGSETLNGAETLRADFSVTLEKETFACMLCFGADGAPVYGEIAQDGKIIAAVEFTDFVFGDILLPDA